MEAVARESESMQDGNSEPLPGGSDTNILASHETCYHCEKQGHASSVCRFRTAKCNLCQKIGHLARVYRSKQRGDANKQFKSLNTSRSRVHQLQDQDNSSESDDGELLNIFQLSNPVHKFIVKVSINGIDIGHGD